MPLGGSGETDQVTYWVDEGTFSAFCRQITIVANAGTHRLTFTGGILTNYSTS